MMKSSLSSINDKVYDEIRDQNRKMLFEYRSNSSRERLRNKIMGLMNKKMWKEDRFFWPHAFIANSLENSYENSHNTNDLKALMEYYDKWISEGLIINNLDNTMNGYALLYVYEKTHEEKYLKAAIELGEYLLNHETDNNGSLPYRYTSQTIFIDSLGMICPFLTRLGKVTSDKNCVKLAIKQLLNFYKFGMDELSGLPYHAYNIDEDVKYGIIGWGRAVGWLMIGLIDTLEYLDENDEDYLELKKIFLKISYDVVKYTKKNGYYSWQLSTVEGPVDTSTTAMITYSLIKSRYIGFNEIDKYQSIITKSVHALLNSTFEGKVYDCSAECRGLSMYPQRFGNFPWAQGPTLQILSLLRK